MLKVFLDIKHLILRPLQGMKCLFQALLIMSRNITAICCIYQFVPPIKEQIHFFYYLPPLELFLVFSQIYTDKTKLDTAR